MQTLLTDLAKCGIEPFDFAGMTFPKHLWTLPRGPLAERLKRRSPVVCGEYYHAPKPIGKDHGKGFYHCEDFIFTLRWKWCDEVDGARINHTGWFADEYCDQKIRGVVFRPNHSKGFLAGWSMGESMASELECSIYADEKEAAYAADQMAERAAEKEREYQEEQKGDEEEDDDE